MTNDLRALRGDALYCKLYVAGAADTRALTLAIDEIAPGAATPTDHASDDLSLDIGVHAESRHLPLSDEQDDFLRWRHYVEVDAASEDTAFEPFLAELARLVAGLRARGLRVVAACDFEDELNAAARDPGRA